MSTENDAFRWFNVPFVLLQLKCFGGSPTRSPVAIVHTTNGIGITTNVLSHFERQVSFIKGGHSRDILFCNCRFRLLDLSESIQQGLNKL